MILVSDPATGELCGFSTQMLLDVEVDGPADQGAVLRRHDHRPRHWGDQALAHVWGRLALSLIDAHPDAELYWFLISQGLQDLSLPAVSSTSSIRATTRRRPPGRRR